MTIKDCCLSLYNFIAWPFRKLYSCFYPAPIKEKKEVVNTTLRGGARRRAFKNKTSVVFYKSLFALPRKLSKEDEDYKKIRDKEREIVRRKTERGNARRRLSEHWTPSPPRPKPPTPTTPTSRSSNSN